MPIAGLIKGIRRLVAVGFIILILLGNYWFIHIVTGRHPDPWVQTVFVLIMLGLVGIGFLWGVLWIYSWFRPSPDQVEPPER